MTEKCGAIGALTVGGRVVGQIKCELEAGHDEPRYSARQPLGAGLTTPYEVDPPEPHAVTLTWTPETEPDLDLFDPAEHFDVEIPDLFAPPEKCGTISSRRIGFTNVTGPCTLLRGHNGPHLP